MPKSTINLLFSAKACVFGIALLVSSIDASAAPFWCDGDETIPSNPLSITALEQRIVSLGIESSHDDIVNLVKTTFLSRQTQIDLVEGSDEQVYLDDFLSLIRDNDGPEDFGFTHQERNNRGVLLKLPTQPLIISCDTTPKQLKESSPTQANIALASHAIHVFGYDIVTGALPVVVSAIDGISLSYRNWLLDQGLAQWPWELAVNGWRISSDPYNEPAPRTQLIFMRPSAGLEFSWTSQSNADVEASVGIEPIGLVWYRGDDNDYSNWWGISALVTLGTGDNGAGIGGLIRYNNFWIGVTDRKGSNDTFVFLGLDLHKYLKSDDGLKADIEKKLAKIRDN